MIKKLSPIFLCVLLVMLPISVHAQDVTSPVAPTTVEATKMPKRPFGVGPTIKQDLKDFRSSNAAMREELKANMEQKRMEFKNRLQTFRDINKKERLLKLDTKLASVSSKRSTRMTEAVTKLQTILDTIEGKGTVAKQNGADTTTLDTAIADAQSALDAASAAVASQATKQYVLTVNDEITAKQTVGTTVKQMQQDLRDTHKLVTDAKQAVMNAAKELRKVLHAAKPSGTE